MRKWTIRGAGMLLALGLAGTSWAAQPAEKDVRELFDLMHLGQMFTQMNSQMAGVMGQAVPCVPASYWQGFIDAKGVDQLMGRMVPVYQARFTADEVAGLIKFYRSPLGQKVIAQMPATMAEGMKIGQQWGRERGTEMIKELQQKGTLNSEGRCPATGTAAPGAAQP